MGGGGMEEEVGGVAASLFVLLLEHVACFFVLARAEKARRSLGSKCDSKDLRPAKNPSSRLFSGGQQHLHLAGHPNRIKKTAF